MILGYSNRLSALPDEEIAFHVSSDHGAAMARVVRLCGVRHDSNELGIAVEEPIATDLPNKIEVREQETRSGSYFTADVEHTTTSGLSIALWFRPTLITASAQTILQLFSDQQEPLLSIDVTGDRLVATANGVAHSTVRADVTPAHRHNEWTLIGASIDLVGKQFHLVGHTTLSNGQSVTDVTSQPIDASSISLRRLVLAGSLQGEGRVTRHFNGRIDSPFLFSEPLAPEALLKLADPHYAEGWGPVLAAWDFSQDMSRQNVPDTGPHGFHGVTVNRPTRGVRGIAWSGDAMFWPMQPELWSGAHFHEDDLEDANWDETCRLRLPSDMKSGLYALRLDAGGEVEYIPFYVRGKAPHNPVLFLAPTNTYLAYANERLAAGSRAEALSRVMPFPIDLSPADQYLFAHPELGSSLYDRHLDGSGVTYSSRLRPILNMRPNYRTWINAGRRHFAADLYISGWLESQGVPFDMATDEDLDREGLELLSKYRVVVTGSHPEYWTSPMMKAMDTYTSSGGHLMYLGGNGFYWVTAFADEDRSSIEVRRGYSSQRNWTSHAAEVALASTGELGGTWVHRGRAPQKMVGVGSWACGFGPGTGYARTSASRDPEFDFAFDGVDEDPIGNYGHVLGGAAGDELDRTQDVLAEGADVTILMSSLQHDKWCWPFVETQMDITSGLGGEDNPEIRSDVVWVKRPNGSRVFSVGSICWGASMAFNDGINGVSRLTLNVLQHLLGHQADPRMRDLNGSDGSSHTA